MAGTSRVRRRLHVVESIPDQHTVQPLDDRGRRVSWRAKAIPNVGLEAWYELAHPPAGGRGRPRESPAKRLQHVGIGFGIPGTEPAYHRHRPLLRASGNWPSRRAALSGDEFAPSKANVHLALLCRELYAEN